MRGPYRKALQLAKLLLLGASFRDEVSSGGDSFMISLSKVWEASIESDSRLSRWGRTLKLTASTVARSPRWCDSRH
jgi:hypothetical protein